MAANDVGQGSAGSTDLATQIKGVTSQLSAANQNMLVLIAAVQALAVIPIKSYTVATLPSSPSAGTIARITDGASGASWGTSPSGGHSTPYLCWFNGTAWTIIGK